VPPIPKPEKNSVALISEFRLRVVIVIALTFGHPWQTTAAFIGNLLPSVAVGRAEKGDHGNCQGTGDMLIVCLAVFFNEDRIVAVPIVIEIALNHLWVRVWPTILLHRLAVFVGDVRKSRGRVVLVEQRFNRKRQFRWFITIKVRRGGAGRSKHRALRVR